MELLVKARDRFSETEIDTEIVVMSLGSGDFFSLTGTARAIWELIDGTRGKDALVTDLAASYCIAEDEIDGEVGAFLDQLGRAGLLASG